MYCVTTIPGRTPTTLYSPLVDDGPSAPADVRLPERVDHLDLQEHHPRPRLGLVPVHDARLLVGGLRVQFVLQTSHAILLIV